MDAPRAIAVIPARGGSKGLPGKNLAPLDGVPLVLRTIRAAQAASRIDCVIVSSDDPAILALAKEAGVTALDRPAAISGDEASSEAAVLHALDSISTADGVVVMLQCTSPFTTPVEVDALVTALDDAAYDSAVIVRADHGFLWRRDAGRGVGVNHDPTCPRQRRQDLEPAFRETGAGYAMRMAAFRQTGHRFCGNVALVQSDAPAVEIDDAADLALVRAIAATRAELTIPSLSGVRALVTDFDGVHTDDCAIVSEDGTESVRVSRRDGLGIEMLKAAGVPVLILSREANAVVRRRAEKLQVPVIHGCRDKLTALRDWGVAEGIPLSDIAYVGNDVNDIECMAAVGVSCAPVDAHPEALRAATMVLERRGGDGAVREICDLILAARG
ncbi:cytidylyltransferase domain-containing protein [Sphingomonas sp. ID0503]|uniref:cytidylyltransferase domain-containing protein n=1 Tax=Sphingomonas sp. ID0503 TaxID=3399691 RepID=UPI003AFAF776